jgi:GNAT superfamily N-acetyltransferase
MTAAANSLIRREDIRVRPSKSGDIEELTRVINAAFVVERVAFDGDRVDMEQVGSYMDKGTFLVAEHGRVLVGCVYVEMRGERSYLGLLSVRPDRQGLGLGGKLMTAAEDYARSQGSRAMDLRVISPREELVPFYQHFGYEQTGTAPFPRDSTSKIPGQYILMSKPLI